MKTIEKKIIFLDRDGTLIFDKDYLNSPDGVQWIPGVMNGLRDLRDHGFYFIMVTNQSGLARRLVQIDNMDAIHRKMKGELAQNGIHFLDVYYSPHHPSANTQDRKPNPGMIERGLKSFYGDRKHCWMIGDKWADVEAGRRAHINTALLKVEPRSTQESHPEADLLSEDFLDLSRRILQWDRKISLD